MSRSEETLLFQGSAGQIEVRVESPPCSRGIALICHPHPLFGGNLTNKVTQTLARTFAQLGYIALRPNFRGVGASDGVHDEGVGETEDMLAVLGEARHRFGDLPVALAGFSFGAYVQTRVAAALAALGGGGIAAPAVAARHQPAQRLVLVGTAAGYIEGARRYETGAVAPDTLVIHGSADTTVPLENVLSWAQPLELPVVVVPGADHFFHRRLHLIRDIVRRAWNFP